MTEEEIANFYMNLMEDLYLSEHEITKNETDSKFIPLVDKMRHLEKSADPTDPSMMSHKQMSGAAIVIFIKHQMGDFDPDDKDKKSDDKWRNFPRIIVKAMTANTHFFTRLIEMSQMKQVQDQNRYLQLLLYFIFQCIKDGAYDWRKEEIYGDGDYGRSDVNKKVRDAKYVWTTCLMEHPKVSMLEKLSLQEIKNFLIPGLLLAYFDVQQAFKDLRSPFDHQRIPKVLIRTQYHKIMHPTY